MSDYSASDGTGKAVTRGLPTDISGSKDQHSPRATPNHITDSPQLQASSPRPMASNASRDVNSRQDGVSKPYGSSNTPSGQGLTPHSLREQKSAIVQVIDQVVAARTPIGGVSQQYGQAGFKQKYMKGQYKANDEKSPYHNPRSVNAGNASPAMSGRRPGGAAGGNASISPVHKPGSSSHTLDQQPFRLSGPSTSYLPGSSGPTTSSSLQTGVSSQLDQLPLGNSIDITVHQSESSIASASDQDHLLGGPVPLYPSGDDGDHYYDDDEDEDDESLTEDPEIPYSVYGHLRFPDHEQVRYEYYRNPHYHEPLANCIKCLAPVLRVTREERLHFVKLEERYLLWKKRKMHKKRLLDEERRQLMALNGSEGDQFSPQNTTVGYQPPNLLSTTLGFVDPEAMMSKMGHDGGVNPSEDDDRGDQVVGFDDMDDIDPAPQHAIDTESFTGDMLETQSFASATSTMILNPSESPLVSTKLPRSLISWPLKAELFGNLDLSIPLILSLLASYGIGLINLAFQGRISEDALAAAAVAVFYINVTGMAVMLGLNGAIDILGSQAYGAQAYKRVGLITQRGLAVCTVSMVPVALMWYFGSFFLQLLGIEAHVSDLAQDYLRVCIIAIPFIGYMDSFRRYLEVQQICYPPMMINVIGLFLVAPLNWFTMHFLNFGFIGAAYSFAIINIVMFACFLVYIFGTDLYVKTWPAPSMDIFYEWGHYMGYALPAVGALAGEWVAFEIQTIISARLGTTALAAQSLVTSLNAFIFNIPMAIGIAACARTGAFLGANKPFVARHAYYASLRITLVTQACVSVFLLVFDEQVVDFFTDQENVKVIVLKILPFLACFTYVDGFQGMIAGIYRGLGYQTIAFVVNIIGYWIVAVPISIGLALYTGHHTYPEDGIDITKRGMGLIGQWISLLVAGLLVVGIYLSYLTQVDWKERAKTIHEELLEEIRAEKVARRQTKEAEHQAKTMASDDASLLDSSADSFGIQVN